LPDLRRALDIHIVRDTPARSADPSGIAPAVAVYPPISHGFGALWDGGFWPSAATARPGEQARRPVGLARLIANYDVAQYFDDIDVRSAHGQCIESTSVGVSMDNTVSKLRFQVCGYRQNMEKLRHAGDPRIKQAITRYKWMLIGCYLLFLVAGLVVGCIVSSNNFLGACFGLLLSSAIAVPVMFVVLTFMLRRMHRLDARLDRAA
jgi:hypothetical protein